MAKSMRSKREKRLRAIRREIVEKETFHQKKEEAKLVALEAALAAPKVPIRPAPTSPFMDAAPSVLPSASASASAATANDMDLDMADGRQNNSLKPVGGIGKKLKKFKMGKKKRRGKGLLRGKRV